ncbi:myocyte-specific enhancer factor 2D isoform X2 [Synchiropus splendidus]|uniref:myocyte-specific enhancer factor 2D isoform X2 n=1 Tax=Synchiropus splendidus TaxID=270530 RepID=UPI00237D3943|nr:myocyte-specific enhancer factor 2D isoform X2 [Synchiropus splendidus]
MGRKKIQIQRITDERNRQVTFTKRKFGLMKKAYELSVLCDCEIALIIFNHSNKLFQYASTDMDKVLLKYTEYNEPHESRTNADIIEALNKKEHRDSESPDPEEPVSLTPRTEEKYKKIDEEFDKMMQNYRLSTSAHQTPFMPVAVPVSSESSNLVGALPFSQQPSGSLLSSFSSSGLPDPRLLSPQQPSLQRNTSSPGLPARPASAANGYSSARASPGLLSVSNANIQSKPKSPPPSSPQNRKLDLRVITSQSGKSLLQLTEEELELVTESAQRLSAQHTLTTPVVSVASPSLAGPFSGLQPSYSSDYQLSSADLTALQTFTPPSLVSGNMAAWQQQPSVAEQQHLLTQTSLGNLVPVGHLPLTINTNTNVNIKSEPVSPNRDHSTASGGGGPSGLVLGPSLVSVSYPGMLRLEVAGQGHSPVNSLSSNGSTYEGSDRDEGGQGRGGAQNFHQQVQEPSLVQLRPASTDPPDQDSSSVKRMRLDSWVT